MRKMEMREVEVIYCDFCGAKTTNTHVEKCAVCKRDGCSNYSRKSHFVFSLDIFRYNDNERRHGLHVCIECASARQGSETTIQQIFDSMLLRPLEGEKEKKDPLLK